MTHHRFPARVSRSAAVVTGGLLAGLLVSGCGQGGTASPPPATSSSVTASGPATAIRTASASPTSRSTATPAGTATATTTVAPPRGVATPTAGAPASSPPVSGGREAAAVERSLSGSITAVGRGSLQVRTGTGTTAVTWAADTSFRLTRPATTRAVVKGTCVVATRGAKVPGDSASPDTARTIRVSPSIDGACPAGSTPMEAADSRTVSGLVAGVKGTAVTVETKGIGRPIATVRLVLSPAVTVTTSADATSRDAKVGRCAAVVGTTQSSGALAATSIVVSDKGAAGCPA